MNNDAAVRTVTVNTSTASLVSDSTVYLYTVAIKSPSGVTVAGQTTPVTFKIKANSACEPPSTVTPSANVDTSFTIGSSTSPTSITWTDWTYATTPTGGSCLLGYAAGTIPTAISAAVACTASTKTCTLTTASVTEAMVGAHTISITGTTPTGTAIDASKSTTLTLTIVSQCTIIQSATAPATADQSFVLDGIAKTYTVDAWTAAIGTLDCAGALAYAWEIPAAIASAVTTTTTSRLFTFKSSDSKLASTTAYAIKLTATTSLGQALTGGADSATFLLTLTGVVGADA